MNKSPYSFRKGLIDAIPIGLGYLSVSFGFGVMAAGSGLSVLTAVLISMTNLTSAGQVAGLSVITAAGPLIEMALTQLIINLRYMLMGISLTQKLDSKFSTLHRFLTSFFITDEIFAVASSQKEEIGPKYMYGLAVFPYIGWALGTLLGAAAGHIMPPSVTSALGIAIYAMFIAIIVAPAKNDRGVLLSVLIAAALSCMFKYVPLFKGVTQGFSIIICSLAAAAAAALIKPIKEDAGNEL